MSNEQTQKSSTSTLHALLQKISKTFLSLFVESFCQTLKNDTFTILLPNPFQ